jgi:hypothetical protein
MKRPWFPPHECGLPYGCSSAFALSHNIDQRVATNVAALTRLTRLALPSDGRILNRKRSGHRDAWIIENMEIQFVAKEDLGHASADVHRSYVDRPSDARKLPRSRASLLDAGAVGEAIVPHYRNDLASRWVKVRSADNASEAGRHDLKSAKRSRISIVKTRPSEANAKFQRR